MLYFRIICVLFYLQLLSFGRAEDLCHMVKNLSENEKCIYLRGNHYIVNDKDWFNVSDADLKCREHGEWSLVDWKNEEEYNAIIQYLKSHGTSWVYWTAYSDEGSEGNFYSTATREPISFAKFSDGQPDNWKGNENCLHITKYYDPAFALNDHFCNAKWPYICRLQTAIPARAPIF